MTKRYNLPKGYLSASQIGTYQRCPKQYENRYVRGIITPPGIALLRGTAFHAGFEGFYIEKIAGNSPLSPKQVLELSVMTLEEEAIKSEVSIAGAKKDAVILDMKHVTDIYIDNIGSWVPPISVEEEVWYESKCGVSVIGYIDLQRKLAEIEIEAYKDFPEVKDGLIKLEEEQIIVDYKYTGKKWTATRLENSLQFMLYAMSTGTPNVEIHNVTESKKTPKLMKREDRENFTAAEQNIASNARIIRHQFSGDEVDHVEATIEGIASAISAGVFPPCTPDSWVCTPKFCGYWDICRGKK